MLIKNNTQSCTNDCLQFSHQFTSTTEVKTVGFSIFFLVKGVRVFLKNIFKFIY